MYFFGILLFFLYHLFTHSGIINFVRSILERNTKIRLMKLKDVSGYIHLKDMKSIENWCRSNQLDIHVQNRRKYVYEHELVQVLEFSYVNDIMKKHPNDFIERCSDNVSYNTLVRFSGHTASNLSSTSEQHGYLPKGIRELLNTI